MKQSLKKWPMILVGFSLACGVADAATADHLIHRWTFNGGNANDDVGTANGTMASAHIGNGLLQMWTSNKWARVTTDVIGKELTSKTLVMWCSLNELNNTGVGGVSIGEMKGPNYPSEFSVYDGLVFDGAVQKWKAISNGGVRASDPASAPIETVASPNMVMIAVVYDYSSLPNGTVTIYRNGRSYSSFQTSSGVKMSANARLIIGPNNYGKATFFNGVFDEVRLYDAALTADEIASLHAAGPLASNIVSPRNYGFDDENPKWQSITAENTANPDTAWIPMWHRSPDGVGSIFTASRWNYYNPSTWGTRVCLETDASDTLACIEGNARLYLETIQLGGLKAGYRYRVTLDFLMPTDADVCSFTAPLVEFYDVAAGEVFYAYRAGDLSRKTYCGTRQNFEFTTPPVDAFRAGHPLRVRIGQDFRGREAQEYVGSQSVTISRLSFDNFVITEIADDLPADSDATWTASADGTTSDSANWQGGVQPFGAYSKIRFAARGGTSPVCTTVEVDSPLRASQLSFDGESADSSVWELKNAGAGNLLLAGADGVAATVAVGSGCAVAETVEAPNGLVKTGSGTFQIGALRMLGGNLVVRGGRLVLGDELAHRWSFNDGTGNDCAGLCTLERSGNAAFVDKAVKIPGSGWLLGSRTGRSIGEHTLVVWTKLLDYTNTKGGAALLIGDPDYGYPRPFDGLVYSEAGVYSQKWAIGSDYWERTKDTTDGPSETQNDQTLMIAGTVQRGNDEQAAMRLYRNGVLGDVYEKTGSKINTFFVYDADSQILVGPRGWNASNGSINWSYDYNGTVDEARIYRKALSTAQIQALVAAGPNAGVDVSTIPALPLSTKISIEAGATLDLNMRNQRVAELSGAGFVRNGKLRVADKISLSGKMAFDDDFVLESELVLGDAAAGIKTDGALSFAAGSSIAVAPAILPTHSFTMTLFETGTPTDWSAALDGVPLDLSCVKGYVCKEVATDTSYGLRFTLNGLLLLVK